MLFRSRDHCAAPDGKLYFTVTREGQPLRMRRYVYSESFAAIANAAYAKATGDARAAEDAVKSFATYLHHSFTPGVMPPKFEATRPMKGIGPHMIGIATAQELRANLGDVTVSGRTCTEWVDRSVAEIERDFLKPEHFSEELHRRTYEVISQLIRAGKIATVVTLKTFLGDHDLGEGMTTTKYLARLASEATTIINAADYGRTIHDLAVRRNLITIGEDIVNTAFDAPVDLAPRTQIEEAERRLYEIAEQGRYDGGFQTFSHALTTAIDMAAKAYERDGKLSGIATGLSDLDFKMGGLQSSDLIIVAGRPGMGKTALATNIAFKIGRAHV